MNLETKPHPQSYKFQWLSEDSEMTVNMQVEVGFSIGKYEDFVLCDVVPMEACHLLLGRPWQCGSNDFQDYFDDAKESRVKKIPKIQESSFKIQESSIKIKIQDSRFKNQEKTQSR